MHCRASFLLPCWCFALTGALHLQRGGSGAGKRCFFDGARPLEAELSGAPEQLAAARLPELSVREEFVAQMKALPEIPKLMHVAFPFHDVVNSQSDMAKYGIRQMIGLNPDWAFKVWNHTEVDAYIEPHVAPEDWRLLQLASQVERIDLWRMLVLYCEGGFYQDVDRLYDIPMAALLKPETRMLLPQGGCNFAQDLMCTSPGNPVFDVAIRLNLARRRAKHASGARATAGGVVDLGPVVYQQAISKVMFGVMLDAGDAERQARLFELVQSLEPYVLTKKETWCHLIVSEYPNDDCKWISREPMYHEFAFNHWTKQFE